MTESKLKARVLEVAAAIEKSLSIDKATGVASSSTDIYAETLAEGLTMDTVKAVYANDADFIAAGTYVFGKVSVDAMKANKKLDQTSMELQMGPNQMSVSFDRQKEYTSPVNKDGESNKITKYGVATTTFEVRGGKNSGELKKARQELNALAQEAFGK